MNCKCLETVSGSNTAVIISQEQINLRRGDAAGVCVKHVRFRTRCYRTQTIAEPIIRLPLYM